MPLFFAAIFAAISAAIFAAIFESPKKRSAMRDLSQNGKGVGYWIVTYNMTQGPVQMILERSMNVGFRPHF